MTTTLLRKALHEYLGNNNITADERNQITATINELDEIDRLAEPDSVFEGECYVLHSETVSGLLNVATYDAYGKLYVKYNGYVGFSDYEQTIRDRYECGYMPTAAIELGYDIIRDLYSDNEADGVHNPDGTFNHNNRLNLDLMNEFISDNIDQTDAYYIQYQQAKAIMDAWSDDLENGSPTAATDQAVFIIGNKALNIGCFNAEAVSAFDEALLQIMQNAVENIYNN